MGFATRHDEARAKMGPQAHANFYLNLDDELFQPV
jgi:hypothetical protein